MRKKIPVKTEYLSEDEIRVLQLCAKVINPKAKVIKVTELGRVGNTGARLLLVFFEEKKEGFPFVVKLNKKDKIQSEYRSTQDMQVYFSDAQLSYPPVYYNKIAAMAYPHLGGTNEQEVKNTKELKDVVFDMNYAHATIEKYFKELYDNIFKKAHGNPTSKKVKLYNEYKWYLRNNKAKEKIKSALGKKGNFKNIQYLGTQIVNPISLIEDANFINSKTMCKVGPVHGDLHPNNVIFDFEKNIHLLDFAWSSQKRHLLADFVLMENSLRFFEFPKHVNIEMQLTFDQYLLEEDVSPILSKIESMDLPLKPYY